MRGGLWYVGYNVQGLESPEFKLCYKQLHAYVACKNDFHMSELGGVNRDVRVRHKAVFLPQIFSIFFPEELD